jgi:peptide/nickel transport system permease protein
MATTASTGTEFSADEFASALEGEEHVPPGLGPWKLAWRRLRRNRVALFFGAMFLVIVLLCLLAPVYSSHIAHIGPNTQNIIGQNLNKCPPTCTESGDIGIPPTWHSSYFFGADNLGRDLAVRLLYGGRNSLQIGAIATLITMFFAVIIGLVAGYFRGVTDGILSRLMDIIWAFPVLLLGIALGTILAVQGIGPLHGNSLIVPSLIIGLVYIPYVGKPIRGQVLTLREREFIDAARQQGLGHLRIVFSELMPNLASTIVVFVPLIMANAILLEAGLTYLGAGVQPPTPSWGTMITDGINSIPLGFHEVLIPGIMLVLTVLSINIFGDGLRDALDPRAKVRISH